MVEAWLRGPIDGVTPVLIPAAHALVQAREDIEGAVSTLAPELLWVRLGGAAPLGFHLRHIAGSIDRLLAYSRGQALSAPQVAELAAEDGDDDPAATAPSLIALAGAAIDQALLALRGADPTTLHTPRSIGRAQLPSSVFGVLCHIAEHTQRHAGQIVTTAKVVRGTASRR